MKVLLATLHAKYVHASLALPSLAAAIADLPDTETVIRESTVNEPRGKVLESLVRERAEVVAFSCYIWNIEETLKLADDLKQVAPQTFVILGGPEAGHGVFELMTGNPAIDAVIRGEGEETFRAVVAARAAGVPLTDIDGITVRDDDGIAANPDRAPAVLDSLPSPFAAGLVDLTKPLVYYETSRGCPFSCAFCMSSLEKGVRSYSRDRIESDLAVLLEAQVKTVKFVDRTFNYDSSRAIGIWRHILAHNRTSRFHFEIAADLLDEASLAFLATVPPDTFRFEIGIQSGVEAALDRVARRSDLDRVFANVRRLLDETRVTVHLDLVAGLPHEDLDGFLRSLDRLLEVGPHHIQVEPLKVLKGSPMRKIAREEGYRFSAFTPYTILSTPWLSYADVREIEAIAQAVETFCNSGIFTTTLQGLVPSESPSQLFRRLAAFHAANAGEGSLSRPALFGLMADFITTEAPAERAQLLLDALAYDYCLSEYPSSANPPSFLPHDRRKTVTLPKEEPPPGTRIRTHARSFRADFTTNPWREEETTIVFRYISAPGKGLTVEARPFTQD